VTTLLAEISSCSLHALSALASRLSQLFFSFADSDDAD
jgi:hypothetical protein